MFSQQQQDRIKNAINKSAFTPPIPSEISRENARAKVFCGIIYFNQIKTIIKKRKKILGAA